MNFELKTLSIIFFCSIILTTFGESNKIDSLLNDLKLNKADTSKVLTYAELCWEFQYSNPDTSIYFGKKGIELALNINFKSGLQMCYNNLGVNYLYIGNYNEALEFLEKSLKICKESNYKNQEATAYLNIGMIKLYQGSYDIAVSFYLKSLKIYEAMNEKNGIAKCFANIGMVYHYQMNYEKATEYYLKAMNIFEEINDKNALANMYNNLGTLYSDQKNYNTALEFFFKAVKASEELGDISGLSGCYGNIGNVYNYQGDYNKAIEYYLKSMKLSEELGDKNSQSLAYILLAYVNTSLSDSAALTENQRIGYLNKAIEWGTKGMELAKEIKAVPLEKDAAEILMNSYRKIGNLKKAIEYYDIFLAAKDSIFSEEKTKALTEMGAKYESEKRELTIQKLEKEKELQNETIARKNAESKKQRILLFSFLIGFIIILVFSIFLYRLFIQKKKANILLAQQNFEINQQKEEISAQRDEISAQRDLVTKQKEEIEHIHEELTDSINYAKRIQEAVLPISPEYRSIMGEHFILFRPKDIVSGDFYWTAKIENTLIVAVADCTGHGVPGAFMSMLGISFLNEIVRKKEITKANDVLNELRKEIINALQQKGQSGEQKDGMDMSLVAIDTKLHVAQWAGANNPLYIVRNNDNKKMPPFEKVASLEELKPDKMPIAIYEKMDDFSNHELQLNSGDILYLMSDGYEDQFGGPKGKKFLSKNLKQLLTTNCKLPMQEQKHILEKTLNEWIGEGEQIDDITVLGIKI
ncbi:MAG: hypothetical protein A2046_15915 [Bacteroidetes bacterium GWA2_30_7]|nr:MAG: hypothetical protein A2046_15915 [Bacteroidetes bacterium GWA2_30_7]